MATAQAALVVRQVSRAQRHDRTRVVFCIDNMQIGGTELNAVRTAELLDRTRFDVAVVCLQRGGARGPLLARYEAAGIPVLPFPIKKLYGVDALRQGLRLTALLRRHRADVFHAHDFYSNIFGVFWARLAGTRAVALLTPRWPELHVVIVGEGPCRHTLATLSDRLELGGRVHFTGLRDDGPRLHQLFEVSALCSLSEGFPNTLLEAMAQAVPVVATEVGGTRDVVSHGTTGLLVPPAHPEVLAAALDGLLADRARATAMGLAAQRH